VRPAKGIAFSLEGKGRLREMPICAVCVRAAGMRLAQKLDGDTQAGGKA